MKLKRFLTTIIMIGSLICIPTICTANTSAATNLDNTETRITPSEVKSLPGGGEAYIYYIDGVKNTFFVPPKGFNPLKATDAQLAEYGFQPRPIDEKLLAEWEDVMSHYKSTPIPTSIHVKKKDNSEKDIKTDISIVSASSISNSILGASTTSTVKSKNWSDITRLAVQVRLKQL